MAKIEGKNTFNRGIRGTVVYRWYCLHIVHCAIKHIFKIYNFYVVSTFGDSMWKNYDINILY